MPGRENNERARARGGGRRIGVRASPSMQAYARRTHARTSSWVLLLFLLLSSPLSVLPPRTRTGVEVSLEPMQPADLWSRPKFTGPLRPIHARRPVNLPRSQKRVFRSYYWGHSAHIHVPTRVVNTAMLNQQILTRLNLASIHLSLHHLNSRLLTVTSNLITIAHA